MTGPSEKAIELGNEDPPIAIGEHMFCPCVPTLPERVRRYVMKLGRLMPAGAYIDAHVFPGRLHIGVKVIVGSCSVVIGFDHRAEAPAFIADAILEKLGFARASI